MTRDESISKDILLMVLHRQTNTLNNAIKELLESYINRRQQWITEDIEKMTDLRDDIIRLIRKIDCWEGDFMEVEDEN